MSFDNNPKCFLSKLKSRLDNIDNIKINSTIIPELFKYIPLLIEKNTTGPLNFVNKGSIYLHEILTLTNIDNYKKTYDDSRQFGLLDTSKLEELIETKLKFIDDAIIDGTI
jgi:hypothetical protein